MIDELKRLVVGVNRDPKVVGACRAFLLYAIPIGAGALIAYLGALHDPRWLWLAALVPVIRAIEGAVLDQLVKPSQNAVYPRPPAGEKQPPPVPPN